MSRNHLIVALAGVLTCFCSFAGTVYNVLDVAGLTAALANGDLANGDEIVLANGTYTLTAGLVVTKGITIRSASGNPEDVKLDGAGKYPTIRLNNSDAVLQDVVVQNGKSDGSSYTTGANIRIDKNGGTVENCVVRGGTFSTYCARGSGGGAGIACVSANGLIRNCVITNNNCSGNTGVQQGGGLYMTAGLCERSFVSYNKAPINGGTSNSGGGAYIAGSAKLRNCTLAFNSSVNGGGVDAYAATASVENCLIWGNAGDAGTDVYLGNASVFSNCVASCFLNGDCISVNFLPYTGMFLTPLPGSPCFTADIGYAQADPTCVGCGFSVNTVGNPFSPATISFTAGTSGLNGITEYAWDFDGDGNIDETTSAPSVSYELSTGYYAPVLTVTHSGGTSSYTAPTTAVTVYPKTMYVNGANANPEVPYDTKGKAAKTIAAALAIAADGQEIIVMKEGSPYGISEALRVTAAVTLRGETGNPEDVVIRRSSGNISLIRINHKDAFVHSFALQGGYYAGYGTAVGIEANGGTLSNCVARGSSVLSYWSAGTIYANSANALVSHCVITNNIIYSNAAGTQKSAGLDLRGGAVAKNCLIANNRDTATSGENQVGGVYIDNGTLYNSTIVDNRARRVGGIWIASGNAYNCVIAGNASIYKGAGYESINSGSDAKFHNCVADTLSINEATCRPATAAASMFANYAARDYSVATGSVLVDGGTDDYDYEATDITGFTRKSGQHVDIGAYEFDSDAFSGGFSADITSGIIPQTVTFTASTVGGGAGDVFEYEWDFDGDGVVDETTAVPTVTRTYSAGGHYNVNLTIKDITADKTAVVEKPGLLYFVNKKMYVVPNYNPTAAFPYDTWEKATSNLYIAVEAALDGLEIIVSNGLHKVKCDQLVVAKDLDVHSLSENPADTIMRFAGIRGTEPAYKLNHGSARIHGFTWTGGSSIDSSLPGWLVDVDGGTISNCVLTGFNNYTYWASAGAVTLSGNNALVTHCVITNNLQTYIGDYSKAIVRAFGGTLRDTLIAENRSNDSTSKDLTAAPILKTRGTGVVMNCTIASNTLYCVTSGKQIANGYVVRFQGGAATNCVFALNALNGAIDEAFTTAATGADGTTPTAFCRNFADTAAPAFAGWYCGTAADFFTGAAKDLDWACTSAWLMPCGKAACCFRGSKKDALPAKDLAGRNRMTKGHLDLGCYQSPHCPLTLLVR